MDWSVIGNVLMTFRENLSIRSEVTRRSVKTNWHDFISLIFLTKWAKWAWSNNRLAVRIKEAWNSVETLSTRLQLAVGTAVSFGLRQAKFRILTLHRPDPLFYWLLRAIKRLPWLHHANMITLHKLRASGQLCKRCTGRIPISFITSSSFYRNWNLRRMRR
jgi:hypothetical protein